MALRVAVVTMLKLPVSVYSINVTAEPRLQDESETTPSGSSYAETSRANQQRSSVVTRWLEHKIEKYGAWSLLVIVILLLICALFRKSLLVIVQTAQVITVSFACATLVQTKRANEQASKANQLTEHTLTADILLRLYETYMTDEMHQAIIDIWQTMKHDGKANEIQETHNVNTTHNEQYTTPYNAMPYHTTTNTIRYVQSNTIQTTRHDTVQYNTYTTQKQYDNNKNTINIRCKRENIHTHATHA